MFPSTYLPIEQEPVKQRRFLLLALAGGLEEFKLTIRG